MIAQTFGEKLKELREARGWSRPKAATALGISRNRLEEIELGVSRATGRPTTPRRELVVKAALVFNLPKDYLLELAGYVKEHPDLDEDEVLLLNLFRELDEGERSLALRLVKAIKQPEMPETR